MSGSSSADDSDSSWNAADLLDGLCDDDPSKEILDSGDGEQLDLDEIAADDALNLEENRLSGSAPALSLETPVMNGAHSAIDANAAVETIVQGFRVKRTQIQWENGFLRFVRWVK
ncbi:hypothetical protein M427DRAFT_39582 [Gonapodya prolifera JEL478]|uniref:Uncharacterized protein n=1 Tax=Gonapodya prolifera (strain JEL478) TaxID=1344416 RepID=A0A138ZYA2_GONPJ|nr:hypothetical protein M427DRAFT_39582 [Gonapodya prolifera JEL478]|eukprot:KXS09103.1 hypothetical protein M427DRAFT_39582 [Gonapodya prolifera JEL478]